jgi:hypothetical protein
VALAASVIWPPQDAVFPDEVIKKSEEQPALAAALLISQEIPPRSAV